MELAKQACSFLPSHGDVICSLSGELLVIYGKSLTWAPVIPLVYDYGKTNRLPPKCLVLGGEFSRLKYLVRIF